MWYLEQLYLHSTNGGIEGRTTVESKPTEPDEDGTKEDECGVVWLAVRRLASTLALAQHKGVGETGPTGSNVDRSASCVIKRGQVEEPSVGVPGPAGDRVVDDGGPDEHEDDAGQHAAALGDGSDGQGYCYASEHSLVDGEEEVGDLVAAYAGGAEDVAKADVL